MEIKDLYLSFNFLKTLWSKSFFNHWNRQSWISFVSQNKLKKRWFHAWAEKKPPWPYTQRKYKKQQKSSSSSSSSTSNCVVLLWCRSSEQPADTFTGEVKTSVALWNKKNDRCLESKNEKSLGLAGETCSIDSPRQQEIRNQLHLSPEKWTTRMPKTPKNTHPALLKAPCTLTQRSRVQEYLSLC